MNLRTRTAASTVSERYAASLGGVSQKYSQGLLSLGEWACTQRLCVYVRTTFIARPQRPTLHSISCIDMTLYAVFAIQDFYLGFCMDSFVVLAVMFAVGAGWWLKSSLAKRRQPNLLAQRQLIQMAVGRYRSTHTDSLAEMCARIMRIYVHQYLASSKEVARGTDVQRRWFEYYLLIQLSRAFSTLCSIGLEPLVKEWFEMSTIFHYAKLDTAALAEDRAIVAAAAIRAEEHLKGNPELIGQFQGIAYFLITSLPDAKQDKLDAEVKTMFDSFWRCCIQA